MNHVTNKTWRLKGSSRYKSSDAGARYCIVGAGVLLARNRRLMGEWAPRSVRAWPAQTKVRQDDYHGNLTGELFERYFGKLCAELASSYGTCRIHLDGAAYHKCRAKPPLTQSATKQVIQDWPLAEGVPLSASQTLSKRSCARSSSRQPTSSSTWPSSTVMKCSTRPYHPELQPIEMIWGGVEEPRCAESC